MNIGAYIRAERESLSLSQSQLAERMGSSRSFISQVENGTRNLTIENLAKFADALGKKLNPELFINR